MNQIMAIARVTLCTIFVTGLGGTLASCEWPGDDKVTYDVALGQGTTIQFRDGVMTDVNACIERNTTDALSPGGAEVTCAWMHSVSYNGLPPGVAAYFAFEWPNLRVTTSNKNSMILLTSICVRLQFADQGTIENACGALSVGPQMVAQNYIFLRPELEVLGITSDDETQGVSGSVSQMRYIQIAEPVEEE